MKKLSFLLFLVLLASPSYAPITLQQTKDILQIVDKIQSLTMQMYRLATATNRALINGNSFGLEFSTKTYGLTAGQEQDIINYYNNLKSQMQAQFDALP